MKKIEGSVFKFGDDVNTDEIIPAKYLVTTDEYELGKYCMSGIRKDFIKEIKQGDIIVAGENFGCGSSREHAPLSIKGCGISCVIAKSFARIFYRNSIDIGLPILECQNVNKISGKDVLRIDLANGIIENLNTDEKLGVSSFSSFIQEIISSGGLLKWIDKQKTDNRG